jgi:exopolysaccharide biosynthesis polyprenyl glycosylphosphotransferase
MTVGQIYIAPLSLLAFGAELLWLVLSALVLSLIGNASIDARIATGSLVDQTAVIILIYLSVFYLMDLYQQELLEPGRPLLLSLTQAGCVVCVVIGGLEIWTNLLPFDPFLTLVHLMLTAAFVVSARAMIKRMDGAASPVMYVGIIAGEPMRQLLQAEFARQGSHGPRLDWLGGSLGEAQAALESRSNSNVRIFHLAIEPEILDDSNAVDFLQKWRTNGVCFEELQSFVERTCGKILLGAQLASSVANSRNLGPSRIDKAIRRTRDLGLACLGLLVTLPLNLVTALAIKLESPGPVFFQQERIGENGRRFVMLKFRSMYQDMRLAAGREWTTHQGDPRITRVGKVIRLLHLDELPQLINVLRGEMSLVGPRPFHSAQVAELESLLPSFGLRHLVRPGITGWAQITCDYEASLNQRDEVFARDLYYVKHGGFLFDLFIMLATIKVCLWRRGAR